MSDSVSKVLKTSSKPGGTPYLGGLPAAPAGGGGSVNTRHVVPVHRVGVSAK